MAPIISLLLPTRERPHLVRRFFNCLTDKTQNLDDVELILYIDEDDQTGRGLEHASLSVEKIVGPRTTMGAYLEACLARSKGEIIVLVNDDMIIRTENWDRRLLDFHRSVEDGIYLAYVNDLFRRVKVCTFPILGRRTCEVLMEPFPASYKGAFIDYHLFDIFKRLKKRGVNRIHYFNDLIFQHLHYRTGKTPLDATYTYRRRFADDSLFFSLSSKRQLETHRLYAATQGKSLPTATPTEPEKSLSMSPFKAFCQCFQVFFMDRNLPLVWRSYLFLWFYCRCLVSQGRFRLEGPSAFTNDSGFG